MPVQNPLPPITGRVVLVGAGPGDPELLTLKAVRCLKEAHVVLYDRLIGEGVLDHCRPEAERIFVGKRRANHHLRQVEINELLVQRARRGQTVVRLKGGDPMIFGRGGEEISALLEAGVPFEVVPGVTAASGCAAHFAIPLTHRDHAHSLVLATGHTKDGEPDLNWDVLCQPGQTLLFYMGHTALAPLCRQLINHGLAPSLPAAAIENGTLPEGRCFLATLADLPEIVASQQLEGPALIVVGNVARFADPTRGLVRDAKSPVESGLIEG
jgi:uroporphyrin-III C-methyltransferase/precorrin-2 dehydrogenase/sirohydrochlorin ferrochelatase